MTTATITAANQRTQLVGALAAGAAFVLGAAIGFAWETDSSTSAATHSPPSSHSYTRYFYWVAPSTPGEFSGSVSGSRGGASPVDDFSGTTHPYPIPR